MTSSYVIVMTTVDSRAAAESIAEALVGESLVACVNIVGPIRSIYRWQGAVERSDEFLCIAKTTTTQIEALKQRLPELHSYEVPELVVVPILDGATSYLDWIGANVRS